MGLGDGDAERVTFVIDLLESKGVSLDFPYSSALKESKVGIRELRVQSSGRPLRVLYGFDPLRQAVLLLGGDKTGDDRFYEWAVPRAEKLWLDYLSEFEREG